ncbi:hypothetical protein [Aquimarina celericrescens]|uniref:Uncharacterized protein n=1 Tax=Aquimarina celericrescens TaxID=1964542 RepID=A0ABW5B1C5_9FLAO|nr:hypothetical protein [Aquimarina celericrescens]
MKKHQEDRDTQELTEHFFRNEYGKMVSVVTRYLGTDHIKLLKILYRRRF